MTPEEEHAALIRKAVSILPNGSQRLSIKPIRMGESIQMLVNPPDPIEWDDQDYDVPLKFSEIGTQYYEETKVIETLLTESVGVGGLKLLQDVLNDVGDDKFARNRAITGYASQIWYDHAIPIRFHENSVYIIWPPNHSLQQPIVHDYNIGEFFMRAADKVQRVQAELDNSQKGLSKWKTIGIWSLFLLILVVASLVMR
jgi:hypothetical protein